MPSNLITWDDTTRALIKTGITIYGTLSIVLILSPVSTAGEGIIAVPVIPVLIGADTIHSVVTLSIVVPELVFLISVATIGFSLIYGMMRALSELNPHVQFGSWKLTIVSFLLISGLSLFAITFMPPDLTAMGSQICQQSGSDCFTEFTVGYFTHPANELRLTAITLTTVGFIGIVGNFVMNTRIKYSEKT